MRLSIESSTSRPRSTFQSVQYRGNWFYIDDSDLDSKASFNALYDLWQLAVKGPATQTKPVTTIRVKLTS